MYYISSGPFHLSSKNTKRKINAEEDDCIRIINYGCLKNIV